MGNPIQIGPREHIPRAVGIHRINVESRGVKPFASVPHHRAVGLTGDGICANHRFERGASVIRIAGFRKRLRFVYIAKKHIHPAGHQHPHPVPERGHDGWVAQRERYPRLPRARLGLGGQRRVEPFVRGDKIAFDIQVFAASDHLGFELFRTKRTGDAQVRIHRAIGVVRDHHEALARNPVTLKPVGSHPRRLQVPEVKISVRILRHLARIICPAAEVRHGDHGIRSRTSRRALQNVIAQAFEEFVMPVFFDQRHHAFLDSCRREKAGRDPILNIHQRVAHSVHAKRSAHSRSLQNRLDSLS